MLVYFSFEYVYNNYIVYDELYNGNFGIMYGCVCIVDYGKFGKGLELGEDGNVIFDVERFYNWFMDVIIIVLWFNLL